MTFDNTKGAQEDVHYKTNGRTTLDYYLTRDGEYIDNSGNVFELGEDALLTMDFKVPAVKSLFTDFAFTKVAGYDHNAKLPGAVFTLKHTDGCGAADIVIDTGDATGVNTKLPSGHTYELTETTAPNGYTTDGFGAKSVTVSWGEMSGDTADWTSPDYLVENQLDPRAVEITVTKNWQGDSALPGSLPISFTGKTETGTVVSEGEYSLELTGSGKVWTDTIELPTRMVLDGQPVDVVWTAEEDLSGTTYVPDQKDGNVQNVTYSRTGGTVTFTNKQNTDQELTINKVWLMPGEMQKDVSVTVTGGGNEKTATIGKGESSVKVTVPTYDENGTQITYQVEEDITNFGEWGWDAPSYSCEGGITITNAVKQQTFAINGAKVWKDGGKDHSGETITVTLTGKVNGEAVDAYTKTTTLSSDNKFVFTDVPMYDISSTVVDGKVVYFGTGAKIEYSLTDDAVGYTVTYELGEVENGVADVTLTNTIEDIDARIDINGQKFWNDSQNAYNTRPESVELTLQKLVGGSWEDVEGVEPIAVGNGAVKTEEEVPGEGGETPTEPEQGTEETPAEPEQGTEETPAEPEQGTEETPTEPEQGTEETPTEPEQGTEETPTEPEQGTEETPTEPEQGTEETPTEPEQDAGAAIDTGLTTNGPVAGSAGGSVTRTVYTYDKYVSFTFPGLPKYDESGAEIQYQVMEKNVPDGYVTTPGDADNSWTVTNTLDSGSETNGTITVSKTWVDPYTDETREDEAVITVSGTNGYEEQQSIKTNDTLTFNVPVYDEGAKVNYTVTEAVLSDYVTTVDGAKGNSTTVQAGGSVAFKNTIAQRQTDEPLVATKTWNDQLTDTSKRPSFTLTLWRENGMGVYESVKTLDGNATDTTYDFGVQDVYDTQTGHVWTYSVKESITGGALKDRYNWSYYKDETTGEPDYMHIVNTFNAGEVTVAGQKAWVKANNAAPTADEIRAVKISVYKSTDLENAVATTGLSADGLSFTFENLPEYDAATGEKITYVVKETEVPGGYTSSVSDNGSGYTITNKADNLTSDEISIHVSKTWVGPEADRPDTLRITLKADGETYDTYELRKDEAYSLTIGNLPKYNSGNTEVVYTVEETDAVEDGEGNLTYTSANGLVYDVAVEQEGHSFTITNTIRQVSDVTVAGEKLWSGAIPEEFVKNPVTIQLYANGVLVEGKSVQVGGAPEGSDTPDWTFSFENLPAYALPENGIVDGTNGEKIVYTVKEIVDGNAYSGGLSLVITQDDVNYQFTVDGGVEITEGDRAGKYDITNTFVETEVYQYQVIGHYITITDGVAGAEQTQTIQGPTKVAQGSAPIAGQSLIDGNTTGPDGNTYTYDAGHEGEVLSITVENPNQMYELHVYYIREVTTHDPDPGDPDPGDPDNPPEDEDPENESEVIVTPDRPRPDGGGDGGDITIDDNPTPQGPNPDEPTEPTQPAEPSEPADPGDGTTIIDEQPPMGNLPQTGTMARQAVDPTTTLGILAMSLSMVAAGLAICIGRKKEEPTED